MPPVRPPSAAAPTRLAGTVLTFVALTAVLTLALYAGPVTPSPDQGATSLFLGAMLAGLLTVIIRSGFQRRRDWDDELER